MHPGPQGKRSPFRWPCTLDVSPRRASLEFDSISIWVLEVHRWPVSFGTKLDLGVRTSRHIVFDQVTQHRKLVERLDTQANVIHVAAFRASGGTSELTDRAIHGNQIKHGLASTQMDKSSVWSFSHDNATEKPTIKLDGSLKARYSQYDMVDALHLKRGF